MIYTENRIQQKGFFKKENETVMKNAGFSEKWNGSIIFSWPDFCEGRRNCCVDISMS